MGEAYQRGRFMVFPLGVRVLSLGLKMLELLFPVLVVCVPVQLSPPTTRTFPLCGRTIWALQKDVSLGGIRQREVGILAEACLGVPDVVDEGPGLLPVAVGSVCQ